MRENAVGLAAQQLGIDLSVVYLQNGDLTLFNPRIVGRSPESDMKAWEGERKQRAKRAAMLAAF